MGISNQKGGGQVVPVVPKGMWAVVLPVSDLQATVAFYRDVLGMAPCLEQEGEPGSLILVLEEAGIRPVEVEGAVVPLRMELSCPPWELLELKARVEGAGVEVRGPVDQGWRQVLELRDPDGHTVVIGAKGGPEALEQGPPPVVRPKGRHHPHRWRELYDSTPVERMPWYWPGLDPEIRGLLHRYAPLPGRMLELGCGAGNQAARLAAMGYETVGVDLAPAAVEHAKAVHGAYNPRLRFEVADVTRPLDHLGAFDYGFDRGCFHTLPPEARGAYVENVGACIRRGGCLFLKVFSRAEPGEWGPYRFTAQEVAQLFSPAFEVVEQQECTFRGTLPNAPKGIVSVLRRA